jgi:hypothetical protein
MGSSEPDVPPAGSATDRELTSANKAVEDAIAEAEHAANPGRGGQHAAPDDESAGDTGAGDEGAGDDAPEAPPAQ